MEPALSGSLASAAHTASNCRRRRGARDPLAALEQLAAGFEAKLKPISDAAAEIAAKFVPVAPRRREDVCRAVTHYIAVERRPPARRRGCGRPRARRGVRSCARSGSSTGDPDLPEPPPPLGGRSQGSTASTSPAAWGWSHGIGSRIHGHP